MKTILVINSKTGFTQKYADIISNELTIPCIPLKELTDEIIEQNDRIVFGSRIHAGRIEQLQKIKKRFSFFPEKHLVVFATGATPSAATDVIARIWTANFTDKELRSIPHFYMQGGLNYEEMSFIDKTIMKLAAHFMRKKKKKDSNEKGFEQAIKKSYDISSELYVSPLLDYLKSTI